jgi:hypothetical protein
MGVVDATPAIGEGRHYADQGRAARREHKIHSRRAGHHAQSRVEEEESVIRHPSHHLSGIEWGRPDATHVDPVEESGGTEIRAGCVLLARAQNTDVMASADQFRRDFVQEAARRGGIGRIELVDEEEAQLHLTVAQAVLIPPAVPRHDQEAVTLTATATHRAMIARV